VGHVGGPAQETSNSTDIIETTLRPDVVIISRKTKDIVLLELTILSEENAESAYEHKRAKCQEICDDLREKGWKPRSHPIEVGCRRFSAESLWSALDHILGKTRKTLITEAEKRTLESSNWLWRRKEDPKWQAVE
jgi:hypothetical protein